ncbi:hypothetical protein M409DRAFT_62334 [Zasmidium cellare ATCC 36951]|uniref:Ketoreductase domain-containing protein n=1 Tax=Zasmidium cellare ATCC 36951 TaxID=1080233 RepID=A0A6A6D7I8_ZASCE|nr:uncharacterized protein M409DRAFT_62334 [Zasmidium cellare ATCC 36951]KAF2174202.1 hypothetical protein M409DRAFT_62334 [Zasmidium cellare ATCC 36951]
MALTSTLSGRTALVTGGARGIGAAIVRDLVDRGASVFFTYLSNKDLATDMCRKLSSGSQRVVAFQADACDRASDGKIVSAVLEAFPAGIDILVHNAGGSVVKPLEDLTYEEYRRVYELNVAAPLFLTQALLPNLKRPGRIILIGSTGARLGMFGGSLLGGAKAGVEGMMRTWAQELGPKGVTVNCVCPGATDTDKMAKGAPEVIEKYFKARTPIEQRLGRPEEFATVVGFVASDDARWIAGKCILAYGGHYMI